jgi:hypothetical protein
VSVPSVKIAAQKSFSIILYFGSLSEMKRHSLIEANDISLARHNIMFTCLFVLENGIYIIALDHIDSTIFALCSAISASHQTQAR